MGCSVVKCLFNACLINFSPKQNSTVIPTMLLCDKKRKLPAFFFSPDLLRQKRDVKWATNTLGLSRGTHSQDLMHSISHYRVPNNPRVVTEYMLLTGLSDGTSAFGNSLDVRTWMSGPVQCYSVLLDALAYQLPRLLFLGIPGRCLMPSLSAMNANTRSIRGSVVPLFKPKHHLEGLVADGSTAVSSLTDLGPCIITFDSEQPALPDTASWQSESARHHIPSKQPMTLQLLSR